MRTLETGEARIEKVTRRATVEEATSMVGTPVATRLEPSFKSPAEGSHVVVVDSDTGETVAFVTRLSRTRRAELRQALLSSDKHMSRQLRAKNSMLGKGASFGYMPPKPMAGREGCAATALLNRAPDVEGTLDRLAVDLAEQFRELNPDQYAADSELLAEHVLDDWRLGEKSLWTSGVINQTTTLPYHRDGNNFNTWSAMPSIRYGMAGGHLHLPEYDLTFPVGDGDVTWFFGKKIVHGVTPMRPRPGKESDAYRYTCVFYALQGMKNCRTYAEETTEAAVRRTARERKMAAEVREKLKLKAEAE